MDDATLRHALAGDLDGSFEHLVRAYQNRLYGFALRLTGRREEAEEVAQDAFVRAYQALQRYPAERIEALLVKAWLYRIVLNLVRNRARKRTLALAPLDGDLPGQGEIGPERSALNSETSRELAAMLLDLPDRYRAPVVLRHVEGLSYQEMADALAQPVGTIKSNVHRGIQILRQSLGEEMIA